MSKLGKTTDSITYYLETDETEEFKAFCGED